jgi:hypothetical protein
VAAKAKPAISAPKPEPTGPRVDGVQDGNLIHTKVWDPNTEVLSYGDVIQFEGVYKCGPISKWSAPMLFVVTGTVTSDDKGNCVLPIFPSITNTTHFATVNAPPRNNARVIARTGRCPSCGRIACPHANARLCRIEQQYRSGVMVRTGFFEWPAA